MTLTEFNIEEKRTKETPIWVFVFAAFIAGFAILINTGMGSNRIFVLMATLLVLSYLLVLYFPYRNLAGKIVFNDEGIEIRKDKTSIITYDQVGEFKLLYSLRRGIYYNHIDLGNNNRVEIKHGNESTKFFICIRNKKEEKKLQALLLKLYKKGVNINESVLGETTYGLASLNYEEIQKFKSTYQK